MRNVRKTHKGAPPENVFPVIENMEESGGEKNVMKPKRIQRKRTRGWQMSENTVYIGRPSKWGNPFKIGRDGDREQCLALFKASLIKRMKVGEAVIEQIKKELKGKNVACWCSVDQVCHGDVLLKLANS